MTRGSGRQKSRPGKDDAGCMWGFIGMLDFRRKPLKLLLLDGKRVSSNTPLSGNKDSLNNYQGKDDDLNNTTSIKVLIEKEMSTVYHSKRIQRANSKYLCSENDVRYENDGDITIRDVHSSDSKTPANLVSHQCQFQNIVEVLSGNINLSAALQKLYDDKYKNQNSRADSKDVNLLQNHVVLQKTLHEALEPFYKNFNITSNGMLNQSDELLKVLEVIGSDKNMFLNCLQDPNSFLLKHTGKNQNPPLEKHKPSKPNKFSEAVLVVNAGSSKQEKESASQRMSHKQNIGNIFRKKNKSQSGDISCGDQTSQTLDKIVLLKPMTARKENVMRRYNSPNSSPRSPECLRASMENENMTSGFSFRELKKRLRNTIRESKRDDHLVSSTGVLNRIPSRLAVASQSSSSIEESSQLANGGRKKEKIAARKRCPRKSEIVENFNVARDGCNNPSATKPSQLDREGNFQREAKKHMLELLEYRIDGQRVPARRVHKSLEKLLSMPDCGLSSPRTSPARYKDPCLSPRQMRFSPIWSPIDYGNTNRHGLLNNNLLSSSCTTSYSNNVLQEVDSTGIVKEQVKDDSSTGETSSSRKRSGRLKETWQTMFSPPWSPIQDNRANHCCASSTDETVLSPHAGGNNDVDVKALDSTPDPLGSQIKETPSEEASCLSGIMDLIAGDTDLVKMLNSNEFDSSGPNNANERCEDDESASTSTSETAEEKSRSVTTSVPIGALYFHREDADNMIEKPEKPSTISDLEPPFLDEAITLDIADLEHDVLPISPRKLHFDGEYDDVPMYHQATLNPEIKRATCMEEEFKHQYIVSILEASGLSSQETWEGLQFTHQLLDPALYDEVETLNGDTPDNLKLLFDSINEVLVNIHRKYFSCMLGVSSARHHNFHTIFPFMENIVKEIFKGTNFDFSPETHSTLHQIVKKDIHISSWLTTTAPETEDITNSIGDVILEEILQEIVHKMWY